LIGVHFGKLPVGLFMVYLDVCLKFLDGGVIIDLLSALWRVNLMLPLNCPLLDREYTLVNVLKGLASIVAE
jgi:hypothetical protein